MKDKSEVFYCYSPKLKCELLDRGFKYLAKNKHPSTERFYWLFLRTEQLTKYLDDRPKFDKN